MGSSMKNAYMEEVLQQQQRVEQELAPSRKRRSAPPIQQALAMPGAPPPAALPEEPERPRSALDRALDVRITGFLKWKTVVVPPNVYVIHTRRGRTEPVNIGLGLSFSFNPWTDAFLLVPAAVQTLLINARSICKERQGVLLQAYVQWIVEDIQTAYRKLDFSDPDDPMRVVNVQLSEQAEAAIKDKVSTMTIDEVLTDKQPIIEELTTRLRTVSEGGKGAGLGLKIVTVQIKEAVVSSPRVWENLQRPYRSEQEKNARLAEIENERLVRVREEEEEKAAEIARLAVEAELDGLRHERALEKQKRDQDARLEQQTLEQAFRQKQIEEQARTEAQRRETEQQARLQAMALEIEELEKTHAKLAEQRKIEEAEAALELARLKDKLKREELVRQAAHAEALRELEQARERAKIENEVSPERLQRELAALLPAIAEKLPRADSSRTVTIAGGAGGSDGVQALVGLVESLRSLISDRTESGEREPD